MKRSMSIAAVAVFLVTAAANAQVLYPERYRVNLGDDPRWASPDFDDSGWKASWLGDAPAEPAILWLRTRVDLSPRWLESARPLGVYFGAMASHEIWWDGERIGGGGIVGGTPAEEVPGPIETLIVVPDHLATPGRHTIAIRASTFHRNFSPAAPWWALVIGDYGRLLGSRQTYTWIALSSLSGILVGGFFALILYLVDRRDRSFLVLVVLCFVSAALLVAESWRNLFGYTYDLHIVRLVIVTALSWLFNLVLVTFTATRFPLKNRWWIVGATSIGLFAPLILYRGFDGKAGGMFLIGLLVSGIWSLIAMRHRMSGSVASAIGIGVALAAFFIAPLRFADLTLFFAVDLLLICLLATHAIRVRRDRMERDAAVLRSARLEIELLRRHIQPHFLMNTLTALSEWIEEDPSTASRMIDSLAEEFRLLSEISSRALIPMRDELRLCLLHLELMSRRCGQSYELVAERIDPDLMVPPAVFHTLVENAVTHGRHGDATRLYLRADTDGASTRFVFESPIAVERSGTPAIEEKTGLRYVRARLRESFGSDFRLRHGPEGSVWRTEIRIPVRSS